MADIPRAPRLRIRDTLAHPRVYPHHPRVYRAGDVRRANNRMQLAMRVSGVSATKPFSFWRPTINWALAGVCLMAVALSARGIRDEGALWVEGDMPQYLMD